MDIILVTRFYPPDTGGGGIAAYANYLAVGLAKRGNHVRVVSQMTPQSIYKTTCDGVEVRRIAPLSLPHRCYRIPLVGRQTRFVNDLAYASAVRRELLRMSREGGPDVVEYAEIDAESLFHPFRLCPAVVKLHTPHFVLDQFYSRKERPYSTGLIRWAERKAIVGATALSSPSHDLAEQVSAEYGLDAERIAPMPNGIDTDFFSPSEGEPAESQTVLFVGRLEPRKGGLVFANAIPRIAQACPGAHFVFVGADGSNRNGTSHREELLARFEKEGIRQVVFEGHAAPEVFRDHYRRAAVFVLPSLFENCPYTLLEAMACGRAIVVSRGYGMREMIVDGTSGLFFRPGDSEDLAEKVIRLLEDGQLRRQLGDGARNAVLEQYSLDVAAQAAERFYHETIAQWRLRQFRSQAPNNMKEPLDRN
jgi:glycosyltransferase involved in cell wall biosynthesis